MLGLEGPEHTGPHTGDDWVQALRLRGAARDDALRQLHALMVRAAWHQVRRMRAMLPDANGDALGEIATAAADGALTALLTKLDTFEGRSRFTTWAYKFAILEAASEMRRRAWAHRDVRLEDADRWADPGPGPAELTEARELARAIRAAMNDVLTAHQRRVAVALLVDGIPIDVLADRLGTTRGALYKTLHDARGRLRTRLAADGFLSPTQNRTGAR
ncbi:RNA polymerase sigma factor [Georgenia sp. SYP-B2076]|uniref:RNA polymerase sigma factor n=1 Tax=Georgenia sp. SYP-B2076 TaxID=2495881 RepID=UPI001F0C4F04|nr:sigma-70 family RNA polymerase sigma factor [Georgenia sp. SYP-B2076]